MWKDIFELAAQLARDSKEREGTPYARCWVKEATLTAAGDWYWQDVGTVTD